jgi:hypothetical protein
MQPQPQVLWPWWIGKQYQSCHPGLDDNRLLIRQHDHHAFAAPPDIGDRFSSDTTIEGIDARMKCDWPAFAGRTLGLLNTATDNRHHAAAHRFDFR